MVEPVPGILDQILAARRKRLEEARARVPLALLEQSIEARTEYRDFAPAISSRNHAAERGGLRVIAELKRASPSGGILRRDYSCTEIARSYESAEASALSVLTEPDFFQGTLKDLAEVRKAVRLPVLRKDFILDPYQVFESVAAGADALLLIVTALDDRELHSLIELCHRLRVAALVEVHTAEELDRAIAAGARILGVNNRNLKTLDVDLETSFRLRARIPPGCLAVSESGIQSAGDLRRLSEAEFDAALIGERFMKAPDPGRELAEMLHLAFDLARRDGPPPAVGTRDWK
ncbi:MAG: indole-3-glycerol phosphate synthase TrpC [Acidobacteriia bacterium]|nr:indole-3-glycerol phosphate synthase TrpC [Terriglobia bacterium]